MKNHYKKIMDIINRYDCQHGADRIEAIEEYAKNFSEIKIINCSDDQWLSSIVVFIPFEPANSIESKLWSGVVMISVPQNGQEPVIMNLYQNDLTPRIDQMISVLEEIKNELPPL